MTIVVVVVVVARALWRIKQEKYFVYFNKAIQRHREPRAPLDYHI